MLLHTTVPSYPLHLLLRPACLGDRHEVLAQAPEQLTDRLPDPSASPPPSKRPGPPTPPSH